MPNLLIVDDEKNIREGLKKALEPLGHKVFLAADGKEGLDLLLTNKIELAILDIKMPRVSGFEMLEKIKNYQFSLPVIFLTGHGNVETAVEAMRLGAYDFLTKPINLNKLEIIINRAINYKQLTITNRALAITVQENLVEKQIVGNSRPIKRLIETIKKVAPSKANILIVGESGTGKELVCNAIHSLYAPNKPLIKVNCAALPATLMESELFGHEKGSFTGANHLKIGRFEAVKDGTLFLDEVSEIPKEVQVKLLRVLQEKQIERIGSNVPIKISCRIVSASNKDLKEEIKKGNFREDLFYRLNVIDLNVPTLRERKEDIERLGRFFFEKYSEENHLENLEITPQVFSSFQSYSWPGNIRELGNVIEKLVVLHADKKKITVKDLPKNIFSKEDANGTITIPYGMSLEEAEKEIIFKTIEHCGGNKSEAAKLLNIGRKTLHRKTSPKD